MRIVVCFLFSFFSPLLFLLCLTVFSIFLFFCSVSLYFYAVCARGKMRNALLKRAIADIPIILRMQNEGPGIYNMYQQAMIGEKEWHAFQE